MGECLPDLLYDLPFIRLPVAISPLVNLSSIHSPIGGSSSGFLQLLAAGPIYVSLYVEDCVVVLVI